MASYNKLLGQFTFGGITPTLRKVPQVEVTKSLNFQSVKLLLKNSFHTTQGFQCKTEIIDHNQGFDFTSSSFILQRQMPYYVDKTLFLRAALKTAGYVNISAPRRFMKSTNLDMLKTFLEPNLNNELEPICLKLDENGNICEVQEHKNFKFFTGTKIFQEKKFFLDNFGKHPVIYLDFNPLSKISFEGVVQSCFEMLSELLVDHCFILESRKIKDKLKKKFESTLKILDKGDLQSERKCYVSVKLLSKILYQHFGTEPFLLIDEYDSPVSNALYNSDTKEMKLIFKFLQSFLVDNFKGNKFIRQGVFTSCTHVGGILSYEFNVVEHYPFLSDRFYNYFGFTVEETEELLNKLGRGKDIKTVIDWYDGYKVPKAEVSIVSSWSTLKFLKDGTLDNNWTPRTPRDFFAGLLKHKEVAVLLNELLQGQSIVIDYFSPIGYTEIKTLRSLSLWEKDKEKSDKTESHLHVPLFFQLLWENGYLTSEWNDKSTIELKIPNNEIKRYFEKNILTFEVLKILYGWRETEINKFKDACYKISENPKVHENYKNFLYTLSDLVKTDSRVELEFHSEVYQALKRIQFLGKLHAGNTFEVKEFLKGESCEKKPDIYLLLKKCLIIMEIRHGQTESEKSALRDALARGYHTMWELNKDNANYQVTVGLHMNAITQKFKLSYLLKDDLLDFKLTKENIEKVLKNRKCFEVTKMNIKEKL